MFKDKPLSNIKATAKQLTGEYVGATHYNRLKPAYQPAEVAHAWGLDFLLWNTVRYLSRAGHKESVKMTSTEKEIDDLNKAIDYIQMRINVLSGRTPLDFSVKEVVPQLSMNEVQMNEIESKRVPSEEEVKSYYRNLSEQESDAKEGWLEEPIESFMKRWNVDTIYSKKKRETVMKECWGDEGISNE